MQYSSKPCIKHFRKEYEQQIITSIVRCSIPLLKLLIFPKWLNTKGFQAPFQDPFWKSSKCTNKKWRKFRAKPLKQNNRLPSNTFPQLRKLLSTKCSMQWQLYYQLLRTNNKYAWNVVQRLSNQTTNVFVQMRMRMLPILISQIPFPLQ